MSKKSIQYILLVYPIYKIYMTYPALKRLDFSSEMSTLYGRDTYLIEGKAQAAGFSALPRRNTSRKMNRESGPQ
mgnify:FL=1